MRAATEGVEARPGAGQGVLEAPEAGEVEFVREAHHEADDGFDIAVVVVMEPEGAALGRVLAREVETRDLRVVGVLIRSAQFWNSAIARAPCRGCRRRAGMRNG
ncbi:hypothetical protein FALB51S_00126 [Frigidibacter albus]